MPRAYIEERTKRFPNPNKTAPIILKMGCWRSAIAGDAANALSNLGQ